MAIQDEGRHVPHQVYPKELPRVDRSMREGVPTPISRVLSGTTGNRYVLLKLDPIIKSASDESQSKPGTKMVYPEPCKELRRRISAAIYGKGIVPY